MTAPYYADADVQLWHGDALAVLAELPDASVDAVVTDPPYGLAFMGKDWDTMPPAAKAGNRRGAILGNVPSGLGSTPENRVALYRKQGLDLYAFSLEWSAECLRVLKPGGHLLAFGGTRTYHRLTCAIEDAGFEIRDEIAWLYGSGFPKSLDVSKAIDKAAGAEREVIGQRDRYLDGNARANLGSTGGEFLGLANGVDQITGPATDDAARWSGWGTALKPAHEPIVVARKPLSGTVAANVLAHGTGALNIDGCRVATDEDTARLRAVVRKTAAPFGAGYAMGGNGHDAGRWPSNVVLDEYAATELDRQSGTLAHNAPAVWRGGTEAGVFGTVGSARPGEVRGGYGDTGGASRFFPVFRYEAKAPTAERPRDGGEAHPTVKPLDLMRWLIRLVTPPGGVVLDPFAGSGTTAEACVIEGFRCITIERHAPYLPLIVARLSKPLQPVLEIA